MVRKAPLHRNIPLIVVTAGKPWWPAEKHIEQDRRRLLPVL